MTSRRQTLMPVTEARQRMLDTTQPLPVERVAVADAAGRVLAEPVTARLTQPPHPASAMDGYAVRAADIGSLPAALTVLGEAPAGRPFGGPVGPGEAVRIFTGGVVPEGADTVVIQEDTVRDGDTVTVVEETAAGANIRAAGLDFREGDELVAAGTKLDGLSLSLIAAGNVPEVPVYSRPKIAILATGDELKTPGSDLAAGEIVNSIAPGLAALARDWGMEVAHVGHALDTEAAINAELEACGAADVIVLIGGASVGDYDLVQPALTARGLAVDFSKTALKPGKPVWSGRMGGQRILGLPGNPVSAFVCAYLFLKPLLFAFTGRPADNAVALVEAQLDGTLKGNGPREAFLNGRARLEDGRLLVAPTGRQDSSLLFPLGHANCLINRASGAGPLAGGERVHILPTRSDFSQK